MCLKAYKMNTVVYNTMQKNFTTLESYHSNYNYILCHNNCKVNHRTTGMWAFMCFIGKHSALSNNISL